MRIVKKATFSIFLVILSGVIGFLLNRYTENSKNKPKYLDVFVNYTNLSQVTNHDVKIKFDTNTVENLYRVDVSIFNFNNVDVENIPVYIELFGKVNGNVNVLSEEVWGLNFNKDIITKEDIHLNSDKPSGIKRKYLIKNGRKGGLDHPILQIAYFIDAKDISANTILIDKKGFYEREYNYDNYYTSAQYPKEFLDTWWGLILFLLIVILITVILVSILNRIIPDKRWDKKQQVIIPKLLEYIEQERDDTDVKKIINKYGELDEKYTWEHSSFLSKLIYGHKKPNEEE